MKGAKRKTAGSGLGQRTRYEHLVDPNTDWVLGAADRHGSDLHELGPGGDYFFLPGRTNRFWLPILVGLTNISVSEFAAGEQFKQHAEYKKRWLECAKFSALDVEGPDESNRDFYCAPTVTKGFFDLLDLSDELRAVVRSVTLGLPLEAESLPPALPIPPPPTWRRVRP